MVSTQGHNLLLYLLQLGDKLPSLFFVEFKHHPLNRLSTVSDSIFILVHSQEQFQDHQRLSNFGCGRRADNKLDVVIVIDQELIRGLLKHCLCQSQLNLFSPSEDRCRNNIDCLLIDWIDLKVKAFILQQRYNLLFIKI